jgi:hypothetical protein
MKNINALQVTKGDFIATGQESTSSSTRIFAVIISRYTTYIALLCSLIPFVPDLVFFLQ